MKPSISLRLVALLCLTAAAPSAFGAGLSPDLSSLGSVPLHTLSAPVVPKAMENSVPRKDQAFAFALAVPLGLSEADGVWATTDNITSSWRTRVQVAGAKTLNFQLSGMRLPPGTTLWIYDEAGDVVQGPYTGDQITASGALWTAVVRGSRAVVEARVPAASVADFHLRLEKVYFGYVDPIKAGSLGNSGACEIDTACSQGDPWRNEIRSVGLITAPQGPLLMVLCTGLLVNDVPQDNTPFFLTANHCGIRAAGNSPASAVTVYWLDQASSCSAGNGDLSHNQTGATFVSTDSPSDYTLLRLNQAPAAAANVYYAGWDVTGAGASSGSGLHHPQGDVKKVSLFNAPVVADTTTADTVTVQAWRVTWAQGVTEQGSSGSGLWDQSHHVIGVLTGGGSACAATTSCPTCGPGQPDFYGRLAVAWGNGLKAGLDPANTGTTILCGRNPADASCSALVSAPVTSPAANGVSGDGGGGGALPLETLWVLGMLLARRRRSR